MARNKPVRIWIIRQRPSKDPKFHQIDRFLGAGRSTRLWLRIFRIGWVFRMGRGIGYHDHFLNIFVIKGRLFLLNLGCWAHHRLVIKEINIRLIQGVRRSHIRGDSWVIKGRRKAIWD